MEADGEIIRDLCQVMNTMHFSWKMPWKVCTRTRREQNETERVVGQQDQLYRIKTEWTLWGFRWRRRDRPVSRLCKPQRHARIWCKKQVSTGGSGSVFVLLAVVGMCRPCNLKVIRDESVPVEILGDDHLQGRANSVFQTLPSSTKAQSFDTVARENLSKWFNSEINQSFDWSWVEEHKD